MADLPDHVDVAIVGGGPAGLAAAAELRHLGIASVLLLERDGEAGGVPRFCGHSPFGLREFRRPMRGPAYADALRDAAINAGALIRTGTTVTALGPGIINAVIAIALTGWPPYARVARSEALVVRNSDFIKAARLAGISERVLRMSPSRAMEIPVCWNSCHMLARRMIGWAIRPASMLKAISPPTVSAPSMT